MGKGKEILNEFGEEIPGVPRVESKLNIL
jgi:hypothetical protein